MIQTKFDQIGVDVMKLLGIENPELLGKGDQGWVFRYKPGLVIKVYRDTNEVYLNSLASFLKRISNYDLPFSLPEIFEINKKNGYFYVVEKELSGVPLGKVFPTLRNDQKKISTERYFEVLKFLHKIELSDFRFGQVLKTGEEITSDSWEDFLGKKLIQRIGLVKTQLNKDVAGLQEKILLMKEVFRKKLHFSRHLLVHGDYFYNNVLFDDKLNLTSMIDFSNSTMVGDYRMDVACAIMYFDLDEGLNSYLTQLAKSNYGEEIEDIIKYYTAYQAFFQTESYLYNKGLYKWCLKHLNSPTLWKFIERSL